MADETDDQSWDIRFREDEEMDFFTELAVHEAERWIQAITRKKFEYSDDFRQSLANGVLLCELLNGLVPGTVKRINKLPGAIAGLDNINVFLTACQKSFGLNETQLFDPSDLEDLSQRAISESEVFLKQEVDRRARNVAITIYWLGRAVEKNYKGPQIDASAFTALVHHHGGGKHIISRDSFSQDTWKPKENVKNKSDHRHTRDSSYDSLGSYERESESSLDDLDENNMPVRSNMMRAESTSSIFKDRELRYSAASDSMYSDDKRDSMYQSSPDLSQGSHRHTRSSSTDSMDGSYHGNHSRQSSGSTETYPTRSVSNPRRISSSSADPLQFVKVKKNDDLAKTAEKQMEATAEVNKMRKSVETSEEPEWQSNFDSWKSKLRRKSHHLRDSVGLNDDEEEQQEERKVKTYSQMMAEKEKRRSLGNLRSIYPMDEDEVDFNLGERNKSSGEEITKTDANTTEVEPAASKRSKSKKEDIAPWAQTDSDSQSDSEDNNTHQSFDTDNVFAEQSINKVVTDDRSRMRSSVSSKVAETNRYSTPVKIDKSLSDRKNNLWESKADSSPGSTSLDRSRKLPSQSDKVSNFVKAFEDKDSTASAESRRLDYKHRVSKSFEFDTKISTPPRRSFDSREKSTPASLSLSDKTPPKQTGPMLSPMSPKALLPKNQRYSKTSPGSPGNSFTFSSPASNSVSPKVPPPTKPKPQFKPGVISPIRTVTVTTSANVQKKTEKPKPAVEDPIDAEEKMYTEKTIKINQKPNNSKGFGFFISGGMEKREPVRITRVSLGSSADVCEVQAKDEILSINSRDATTLTQAQAQAMIDGSVKRGQIELKVKRALNNDDDFDSFEEDEGTTSPQLNSPPSQTENQSYYSPASRPYTDRYSPRIEDSTRFKASTQVPDVVKMDQEESSQSNLMNQLLAEKKRETNNNDFKHNTRETKRDNRPPSPEAIEPDATITQKVSSLQMAPPPFTQEDQADIQAPTDQILTEERPTILARRQSPVYSTPEPLQNVNHVTPVREVTLEIKKRESPPPPPPPAEPPSLPEYKPDDSSDSGFGPPAALLRWQRPRPKSEYSLSTSTDFGTKSLTMPWESKDKTPLDKDYSKDYSVLSRTEKDFEVAVNTQKPLQSMRNAYQFEDYNKMEDWDKKQEEARQPEVMEEIEVKPRTPTRTSPAVELIIQKPESLTPQFSSPASGPPPSVELEIAIQEDETPPQQEKFERDQQRIRQQYEEEKRQAREAEKQREEKEKRLLEQDRLNQAGNQSRLKRDPIEEPVQQTVIEPVQAARIHNPPQFNTEPVTIRLSSAAPTRKLVIDPRNQGGHSDTTNPNLPEYSFHVDLKKADATLALQQKDSELSHQEVLELERQRIREEEKRKYEEERRKWEEEKAAEFQKQQEDLRLERERLEKEQERIRREKALMEQKRLSEEPPVPQRYQPVSISNNLYTSPRSSLGSSGSSLSHSPRSQPPALDPRMRDSNIRKSDSNLGPPAVAPKPNRTSAAEKARLTREDMLAMNRKATPLDNKPPESELSGGANDGDHVVREPPSKGELHSLNAVPKQRVVKSAAWIKDEEPQPKEKPFVIGKRSDIIHRDYSNPQDHWMVREAEKRRLADQQKSAPSLDYSRPHSVHTAYTGPIKPFTSSSVNKWKSDSDTPRNRYSFPTSQNSEVRQASPRPFSVGGPDQVSQYDDSLGRNPVQFSARIQPSHQQLSQTLPPSFSFSANPPRRQDVPAAPSHPSRPLDSHAEVMAVSGKQRCSHCGEELGFGAAMVIESLGLYYHVQCFRCCVCRTPLGNGSEGADVRVRVNKLHCQNCYSNDEAGLKFSKV